MPKIHSNHEQIVAHWLIPHDGATQYYSISLSFDGIRDFMADKDIEWLVFHHEDGRMAKIKKRDYQLSRTPGE